PASAKQHHKAATRPSRTPTRSVGYGAASRAGHALPHSHRPRIVRMLHPGAMSADAHTRAWVDALGQRNQRDAVLHRTHHGAEVAADTFGVDHLEMALAVL